MVSETQLKYHRPARLDDELLVTAELRQIGSRVLDNRPARAIKIRAAAAGAPDALLCEGTIRIGWVDAATLRPARIPPQVSGTLERYAGSMSQPLKP